MINHSFLFIFALFHFCVKLFLYIYMKQAFIVTVTVPLPQARSAQLKAVVISERVLGFDHPNTIQQYVSFHMCA